MSREKTRSGRRERIAVPAHWGPRAGFVDTDGALGTTGAAGVARTVELIPAAVAALAVAVPAASPLPPRRKLTAFSLERCVHQLRREPRRRERGWRTARTTRYAVPREGHGRFLSQVLRGVLASVVTPRQVCRLAAAGPERRFGQ